MTNFLDQFLDPMEEALLRLRRHIEPTSTPTWHLLHDDGGVHAMRVHLDAENRSISYSIFAPTPKIQQCTDAPAGAEAIRWEIGHGNVHRGVGALAVWPTHDTWGDVWIDASDAKERKLFLQPMPVDLLRPHHQPWVPLDFGVFTDLLPLVLRFDLAPALSSPRTFDIFVVAMVAPPHRCAPKDPT